MEEKSEVQKWEIDWTKVKTVKHVVIILKALNLEITSVNEDLKTICNPIEK